PGCSAPWGPRSSTPPPAIWRPAWPTSTSGSRRPGSCSRGGIGRNGRMAPVGRGGRVADVERLGPAVVALPDGTSHPSTVGGPATHHGTGQERGFGYHTDSDPHERGERGTGDESLDGAGDGQGEDGPEDEHDRASSLLGQRFSARPIPWAHER